jgi:hypothetical protein
MEFHETIKNIFRLYEEGLITENETAIQLIAISTKKLAITLDVIAKEKGIDAI